MTDAELYQRFEELGKTSDDYHIAAVRLAREVEARCRAEKAAETDSSAAPRYWRGQRVLSMEEAAKVDFPFPPEPEDEQDSRRAQPCCFDCGRRYGDEFGFPDLSVTDDAWSRISPTGGEGGLLCPSCMVRRAYIAGVTCKAEFRSGPFSYDAEPPRPARMTRERAIEIAYGCNATHLDAITGPDPSLEPVVRPEVLDAILAACAEERAVWVQVVRKLLDTCIPAGNTIATHMETAFSLGIKAIEEANALLAGQRGEGGSDG